MAPTQKPEEPYFHQAAAVCRLRRLQGLGKAQVRSATHRIS